MLRGIGRRFEIRPISKCFQELTYRAQRGDAAAGADVHALHRSDGMGKTEYVFQRPLLEQAVNKCAMKNVACARGIGNRNLESV